MKAKKYQKEHLDFLKEHYKNMTSRDLTEKFNKHFCMDCTELAIRTIMYKNKIYCGREPKDRLIPRVRLFSDEHEGYVREQFKKHKIKPLTKLFNEYFQTTMTEDQIKSMISRRGITCGRTGCFPKGEKPWNAGTKGVMKKNSGTFKPGNVPATTKPMYSTRISKDGYIEIKTKKPNPYKIGKSRYVHKHRYVWEQHNGPIPADMIVAFKDSDPLNCDIDNLMLISRTELLFMNNMGYSKAPEPIKPSLTLMAKLKATVAEKTKEIK